MTQELSVTFITHACLKIDGTFGTLVCDPWIVNEPVFNFSTWKYPAATVPAEEVAEGVDYLLLTHAHEDHFHVPSLNYFSRDTEILLPAYEFHPSLRAQTMERVLRQLGFYNIRKFRAWDRVELGGGTALTFVPSAVSRDHDWENCGFVLDAPDCTLLNMNDNLNDRDLCMEIKSKFQHIDIAFVQTAGVSMFPGCFRMSELEMRQAAATRIRGFVDQKQTIDWIRPDRIVPFAGDFCWLDERYFHNNWANRATPDIFDEMVAEDYPDRELEVITLNPSDCWSMAGGTQRHHEAIDWSCYMDALRVLQRRFRPKVSAINSWLEESDTNSLEARSRTYTAYIEQHITRDYIFFEARVRLVVEGPGAGFSFVLKADYDRGFSIDWSDEAAVDQTLYVRQADWASILEGKLMWNIIQWRAEAEQHVPYRMDIGRFFFWLEYHVDLNNRVPQVLIETGAYPSLDNAVDPHKGVFPLGGSDTAADAA